MSENFSDHELLENSVAAYLLGACEPEEAERVRAHLQTCDSCRALADRLSRATSALPLGVDDVKPSDQLRERILEAAAAEPRAAAVVRAPAKVVRLRRPRRDWSRWRSQWPAAAVAVLALAVIGLGGWDVSLSRQLSQAQAAHYELQGTGTMTGSQANVIAFRRDQVTVVDFRNMPQLEPGKVYQVWLIDPAGKPTSAGVFRPDAVGSKTFLITRDVSGFNKLGVTVEVGPEGVNAPTQAPQLAGQIA